MSTELKAAIGRVEHPARDTMNSTYSKSAMEITSFSGGTINGPMIQISLSDSHIQFTKDQVKDLIKTLTDWL
jgi:hypothetical protein